MCVCMFVYLGGCMYVCMYLFMYDDSIIILDFPFKRQEERDIINFAFIFEHPYIPSNTFITSLALTIFRHKSVFSFFSPFSYILDILNVKYIL